MTLRKPTISNSELSQIEEAVRFGKTKATQSLALKLIDALRLERHKHALTLAQLEDKEDAAAVATSSIPPPHPLEEIYDYEYPEAKRSEPLPEVRPHETYHPERNKALGALVATLTQLAKSTPGRWG